MLTRITALRYNRLHDSRTEEPRVNRLRRYLFVPIRMTCWTFTKHGEETQFARVYIALLVCGTPEHNSRRVLQKSADCNRRVIDVVTNFASPFSANFLFAGVIPRS